MTGSLRDQDTSHELLPNLIYLDFSRFARITLEANRYRLSKTFSSPAFRVFLLPCRIPLFLPSVSSGSSHYGADQANVK